MEEAAMRQLEKCATIREKSRQQMSVIPRRKGDTWLRLLSNPPKVKHWRTLNQCRATCKRTDRAFMMNAMKKKDIQFYHMSMFGCAADIGDTLLHLMKTEPLLVLCMDMEKHLEWGGSSGYCWDFTRLNLEKAEVFKDILARLEKSFHIHMGIVSIHKFDWCYNEGECTGSHRMIFTFGEGKKMLLTDGDKQSTLTLPHGSVMILSDVGEKLVKKLPPPYSLQDPSTADENATPKTDPNEPSGSLFLMLDVSVKKRQG